MRTTAEDRFSKAKKVRDTGSKSSIRKRIDPSAIF